MDEKYLYRIKSIQADLEYLKNMSEDLENGLIASEAQRKVCRILLASILVNTTKIQAKMGTDFIPEFENDEILPTSY